MQIDSSRQFQNECGGQLDELRHMIEGESINFDGIAACMYVSGIGVFECCLCDPIYCNRESDIGTTQFSELLAGDASANDNSPIAKALGTPIFVQLE
jgi:hypothetical protein